MKGCEDMRKEGKEEEEGGGEILIIDKPLRV